MVVFILGVLKDKHKHSKTLPLFLDYSLEVITSPQCKVDTNKKERFKLCIKGVFKTFSVKWNAVYAI